MAHHMLSRSVLDGDAVDHGLQRSHVAALALDQLAAAIPDNQAFALAALAKQEAERKAGRLPDEARIEQATEIQESLTEPQQ